MDKTDSAIKKEKITKIILRIVLRSSITIILIIQYIKLFVVISIR